MLNIKKTLAKILKNIKQPIKVVRYGWQVSPAFSERSRLSTVSPDNAGVGSEPAGYTFLCWMEFTSSGWVGAMYGSASTSRATDLWTVTAKGATTGISVYGLALYIRSDLA